MKKQTSTTKTAFSLALVVLLIVAAFFGLDAPYGIEDVIEDTDCTAELNVVTDETTNEQPQTSADSQEPTEEVVQTETAEPTTEAVEVDEPTTEESETQAPTEPETTEEVVDPVETTTEGEVAEPTETQTTATEGDVENA